jgi:hypothetical protein
VKDENGDLLADSHNIWIGGSITSLSYWIYIELVMLGRYKYIQLSRWYMILALVQLKFLLQIWKRKNRQLVIKFRQNRFKQGVKYYCLKSINLLILFGIRNNSPIKGNLLFYQFTGRVMKLTVVIIVRYRCYQFHTKIFPYTSLKVKSI